MKDDNDLEKFLLFSKMIKRILLDVARRDFKINLFLSLIGLVSEEEITLIEIILLAHFGKVQIIPDNIFRFIKNIVEYLVSRIMMW